DARLHRIADPPALANSLAAVPGVMEHGLFIGLAQTAILAGPKGVRLVERPLSQARKESAPMIVRSRSHRGVAFASAVTRYAIAVVIAFARAGAAGGAAAQGAAPNAPPPSQASVLLAKQILGIKHADNIFDPLIRGVVVKTRDFFMQTNFM